MIVIIGCGNELRKDDGVGVHVVSRLGNLPEITSRPDIKLLAAGTNGIDIIFQSVKYRQLIIVDACLSNSKPGTIFVIPGEEIETKREPSHTLHDFRWDHAISAGRLMFPETFPTSITAYLIEAELCTFDTELSSSVNAAANRVVELIVATLKND